MHQAWVAGALLGAVSLAMAQDATIILEESLRPAIAIPDLRGDASAQKYMPAFNQTLWNDVEGSQLFRMVAKTMYPTAIPQQPADWQEGRQFGEWSGPPASARYVAFGYTAVQNGVLVLYGWFYNLSNANPSQAQVFFSRYTGTVDETGARKVAHEFASDIIAHAGGTPVWGTHIYFASDRTGHKEIWVMDADGSNQRQITRFGFLADFPAVSPDGKMVAFTAWPGEGKTPRIYVFQTDPVRDLHFCNQQASVNGTPSFTPDGQRIVFLSSAGGGHRIFIANLDGSGFRPITASDAIDAEPKVNPKTGNTIVFSSDRSGSEQIYQMNRDGGDIVRLSDGTGEASNPSWHPNGRIIAFAWTRGYATGKFNLFWMDVADQKPVQLTRNAGKDENPSWAPDGAHLAFMSDSSGSPQIWTMLADGTQPRQLTTQGTNEHPVWGK